jgi:hypothetical protein
MYRRESWTVIKVSEQALRTFEGKVLWKIYGPTREKGGWCIKRIKYSYELYILYNAPEMVKTVKLGRLRWLGHLTRENKTSSHRKLTFPKPKSTRRA